MGTYPTSGMGLGYQPNSNPATTATYRDMNEAIKAWQDSMLRGGSMPLSYFMQQIVTPGGAAGGGLGGGPTTSVSSGNTTAIGSSSGQSSTSATGSSTLPDDVRARWLDYLDQLSKGEGPGSAEAKRALASIMDNPGYTPEEQARMYLDQQEGQDIVHLAGEPIAGAAENARQKLMMLNAARGGGTPGFNATIERIQEQQGRDASTASLQAKLGVEEANRQAATLIGNGRMGQQNTAADIATRRELGVGGLIGSGLGNFPERNTTATGNTASSGSNTANTSDTGRTTSGPSTPGGTILAGGGGVRPGSTGVGGQLGTPAPTGGLAGSAPIVPAPPKKPLIPKLNYLYS